MMDARVQKLENTIKPSKCARVVFLDDGAINGVFVKCPKQRGEPVPISNCDGRTSNEQIVINFVDA